MSAPRTFAMRSARVALRSKPRPQANGSRFYAMSADVNHTAGPSPVSISHIASGLAGGGAVVIGGVKTAVDSSQRIASTLNNAKVQIKNSLPPPNEALSYLRSVTKSYAVFVPGGSQYVDSVFDSIDELHNSHREEIDSIVSGAYNDIKKITNERKSMDLDSALAILGVLQKRAGELGNVAGELSSDAVGPILDRHPNHAPEVKKLYDDTANKIIDTVKSNGVTAASIATIVQIVREKSDEAKRVAENTAKDAWERARKQAGPALDKMPDIKKVLDENSSTLMSVGGGVAAMSGSNSREIWDRIKQVADSKGRISEDKLNELKNFILEKVEAAKKGGKGGMKDVAEKFSSGGFENMVKMIPGGQETLDSTPNLRALFKVTQSHGEDAQKLAQETYEDVLKVLKEKAEKAKRLADQAH
ncbi:hypothetical protein RSOLAG22IIIB_11278 [Rhizoctonia solani]|uniref:Uncharacterized protein n=1 Tax=Rhizoctonia solani TaxID=456999 RepID=A0A0K6G7D3_9AGAM|nr:hypothetical protein RSOLAG22IIIB_11278 [Rhizoctonia solani]